MDKCFLMLCDNRTEKICLKENLFAAGAMHWLQGIQPGTHGLLCNFESRQLMGVFQAKDAPAENLVTPNPFGGRRFAFQFRVKRVSDSLLRKDADVVFRNAGIYVAANGLPRGTVHTGSRARGLLSQFEVMIPETQESQSESETPFKTPISSNISGFDDVIGLSEAKEFILNRMIKPLDDLETAEKYGLRLGGGLLLFGPPGTGKTRLAEAVAREINAEYEEVSPSVIHGYPGDAERKIEQKFTRLYQTPRSVLFFDEAEALFMKRGNSQSTVMQRVIPILLAQFSKLSRRRSQTLIIGATNQPKDVDPAFLRPGRFDKVFFVDLPGEAERKEMLEFFLNKRKTAVNWDDVNPALPKLAKNLKGYSGADIELILDEAAQIAYDRKGKICKDDVEEARGQMSPSVDQKDVRRYQEWERDRNRLS